MVTEISDDNLLKFFKELLSLKKAKLKCLIKIRKLEKKYEQYSDIFLNQEDEQSSEQIQMSQIDTQINTIREIVNNLDQEETLLFEQYGFTNQHLLGINEENSEQEEQYEYEYHTNTSSQSPNIEVIENHYVQDDVFIIGQTDCVSDI